MYDEKTPDSLKELQTWFGAVITQAIDEESCICPIAPSGQTIEEEAKKYIRPSRTLSPKDRIEIYNQQYWWRLINILHENFPLVTRLFGYFDFNQTIAIPYLVKYPPTHWSLNILGDTLPDWIQECYHQDDKTLIYQSVMIDLCYNLSFTEGELIPISAGVDIVKQKVQLQPHVFLLKLDHDLIPFRAVILNYDPDYFIENSFPKLNKKKHHIAIYRDQTQNIACKEITEEEHEALLQFKTGKTVEEFCSWLETNNTPFAREAEKNLIHWFKDWTALRWLGQVK